jgi:flagellar motor switch protein FliG
VYHNRRSGQGGKRKNFDGARSAVEVLNLMDQNDREKILTSMKQRASVLAQKISEENFIY